MLTSDGRALYYHTCSIPRHSTLLLIIIHKCVEKYRYFGLLRKISWNKYQYLFYSLHGRYWTSIFFNPNLNFKSPSLNIEWWFSNVRQRSRQVQPPIDSSTSCADIDLLGWVSHYKNNSIQLTVSVCISQVFTETVSHRLPVLGLHRESRILSESASISHAHQVEADARLLLTPTFLIIPISTFNWVMYLHEPGSQRNFKIAVCQWEPKNF